MKQYVIFDGIKNGDDFSHVVDAENEEIAIRKADAEWNILSDYDKNRREYFDLAYVEVDEDGTFGSERNPIKEWC